MLLQILIAVVIGIVILRLGLFVVRAFATPLDEPDPDAVVPVDMHFRCSVCGAQVVMTMAPDDDVRAPRHCREEMEAVE